MKWLLSILTLSVLTTAWTQNLVVKISPSTLNPEVGQQFKVVYKLALDGSGSVSINGAIQVEEPDYKGFEVISRKAGRPGFSFGSFDMDLALHQYTVVLKASKEGTYTIDPVSFLVSGNKFTSEKLTIDVGPKTNKGNTVAPKENPNLFGRIHLSRSSVVIGEPVVASCKIYTAYNNLSAQDFDFPKANGFWNEEIDGGKNGWPETIERIGNTRYKVITIKKDLLYPMKTGKLSVPAFTIDLIANRTFFNPGSQITIESNSPTIEVKEIPNTPANFSGLVGSFSMSADISGTDVNANDGIDINIKIEGKGNFNQLQDAGVKFPLDFDVYDPEIKESVRVTSSGLSGSKTFNYLGIPRAGGKYEIGPVELVYFDPKAGKFKTLTSDKWDVTVRQDGQAGGFTNTPGADKRDVQLLSEGIRHIRENSELYKREDLIFGKYWFWILFCTPFILSLGLRTFRKRKAANPIDQQAENQKRAAKIAIASLKQAKNALDKNNASAFNENMLSGLFGYLNHKVGLDMAHLNQQSIQDTLKAKGVSDDTVRDVTHLKERCEMSRYAPTSESANRDTYEQGVKLIQRLDHELAS